MLMEWSMQIVSGPTGCALGPERVPQSLKVCVKTQRQGQRTSAQLQQSEAQHGLPCCAWDGRDCRSCRRIADGGNLPEHLQADTAVQHQGTASVALTTQQTLLTTVMARAMLTNAPVIARLGAAHTVRPFPACSAFRRPKQSLRAAAKFQVRNRAIQCCWRLRAPAGRCACKWHVDTAAEEWCRTIHHSRCDAAGDGSQGHVRAAGGRSRGD